MKRHSIISGWLVLMALCLTCEAGYRTAGKYCGVVVFDRWGGCTLYSGIYVMYVSESIKSQLRPYSGQAIQIDAKEVSQPRNPGDGLIRRLDYLGPAPEGRQTWVRLEGISLASSVSLAPDGKLVATLTVGNTNWAAVKVWSGQLAFTLLTKRDLHRRGAVSDGPSFALITRRSFAGDGPLLGSRRYCRRSASHLERTEGERASFRVHACCRRNEEDQRAARPPGWGV